VNDVLNSVTAEGATVPRAPPGYRPDQQLRQVKDFVAASLSAPFSTPPRPSSREEHGGRDDAGAFPAQGDGLTRCVQLEGVDVYMYEAALGLPRSSSPGHSTADGFRLRTRRVPPARDPAKLAVDNVHSPSNQCSRDRSHDPFNSRPEVPCLPMS
jgi:hypothetical protein